jgi:cephalosporin-C deacetylase-like acetyl esterase
MKRRSVFRVGIAYVVASWVIIEVSSLILEIYEYPGSVMRLLVAFLALGLPFVLFFAWAFEVTPDGIKRDKDVDHSATRSGETGKRLNLVTIAFVAIAIGLFAFDRLTPDLGQKPMDTPVELDISDASIAQRMLEINRLKDEGHYPEAYAKAVDLLATVPDDAFDESFWEEVSSAADIITEPPGARVLRQSIDTDAATWEDLGTTPLDGVRFARGEGYRLRLELNGYRPVELLQSAVIGLDVVGLSAINPITLDTEDSLPGEMLRIRGFTLDLVDYQDFFIDRFEVTNRDFQRFVDAGGYENKDYWQQPLLEDGQLVNFDQARQRFVDRTGRPGPSGWSGGVYPSGQGDYPVGGVSWYEAQAYAEYVGKQLPTITHLEQAKEFRWLDSWQVTPRSNLEADGPRPVGANNAMATTGVYDMIGNVREWCWNESGDDQKCTTGAAWSDSAYHAGWIIPKSPWDRDATHGFRLIKSLDDDVRNERLRAHQDPEFRRDFWSETPASDAEFAIYKRLYAYDSLPLNSEVLWEREDDDWTRQRVAFDLPYGERGGAFVYIPKNLQSPARAVVVWPGSGYLAEQSDDEEFWSKSYDFLVRNGYVVVLPIFKGAYDRDDDDYSTTHSSLLENAGGTQYRDIQIKWMQDLSRTIDYLETRDDVDASRLAYSGNSWGGQTAPIALSVETRFKAAVLKVGGLWEYFQFLPEADPINFVTRVKTPVLMLNGQYDIVFPYETGQRPLFEFLGTPAEHKKHIVTPEAHLVSQEVLIRETLDWLDRYLN